MRWKLSEEQDAYREALRGWLGDVARRRAGAGRGSRRTTGAVTRRPSRRGSARRHGRRRRRRAPGRSGRRTSSSSRSPPRSWAAPRRRARPGWPRSWRVPALASRPDLVRDAVDGGAAALLVAADQVPAPVTLLTVDAEGGVSGAVPRVLAGPTGRRCSSPWSPGRDGRRAATRSRRSAAGVTARRARCSTARARRRRRARRRGVRSRSRRTSTRCLARAADLGRRCSWRPTSLGAMERMLDLAVEYSRQRQPVRRADRLVPGGEARGGHDPGRRRGGALAVYFAAASVEAGRAGVLAARGRRQGAGDRGGLRTPPTRALTMHGAIGYTWEHDLHLFYKRARLDEHLVRRPGAVERAHRRRARPRLTARLPCLLVSPFATIRPQ